MCMLPKMDDEENSSLGDLAIEAELAVKMTNILGKIIELQFYYLPACQFLRDCKILRQTTI